MHGTFETLDGRPAIRFERSLPHPPERVWRAVTEPGELQHWFPEGDAPRDVVVEEPPRRLWFRWGGEDEIRIEIEARDDGCLLHFTHVLATREQGARDAAGWHVCLDLLGRFLDGEDTRGPGSEPTPEWRAHYDAYVEQGVPSGAPVPD